MYDWWRADTRLKQVSADIQSKKVRITQPYYYQFPLDDMDAETSYGVRSCNASSAKRVGRRRTVQSTQPPRQPINHLVNIPGGTSKRD